LQSRTVDQFRRIRWAVQERNGPTVRNPNIERGAGRCPAGCERPRHSAGEVAPGTIRHEARVIRSPAALPRSTARRAACSGSRKVSRPPRSRRAESAVHRIGERSALMDSRQLLSAGPHPLEVVRTKARSLRYPGRLARHDRLLMQTVTDQARLDELAQPGPVRWRG